MSLPFWRRRPGPCVKPSTGPTALLKRRKARWRQVCREHEGLESFESVLPEPLDKLTLQALRDEYDLVRAELAEIVKSLIRHRGELGEPRAELEARYEKSGVDVKL